MNIPFQKNFNHIFQKRNPNGTEQWYKFDDGEVSECKMHEDEELKAQCFGGDYMGEVTRVKVFLLGNFLILNNFRSTTTTLNVCNTDDKNAGGTLICYSIRDVINNQYNSKIALNNFAFPKARIVFYRCQNRLKRVSGMLNKF